MYRIDETYFDQQLDALLGIDSTTGMYRPIQNYVEEEMGRLGLAFEESHKGGVMTSLGDAEALAEDNALLVTAHLDDIGLMVRHINDNGTLNVCNVGGLHEDYALTENVRVYARDGKAYTGSVQKVFSSVHVTEEDVKAQPLDFFKNVCVVLDADVKNAADVRALGIDTGAMIAVDPRCCRSNGYIKSHFIDDKACAAVLLCAMKEISEKKIPLKREVIAHFGMYEEIGHGASNIPERTKDILSLDIACTGPKQNSDEKKATIFCKDASFPYHYEMVGELIEAAKAGGCDYVTDIFLPRYGTDSNTAIRAGYDVRHGAIGMGTSNSHGYERTHMDGIRNLYGLLMAYICK